MNYKLTSKILSSIVMLGGIIVMYGWIFNIPSLTSILPTFVSMKFITALSFFFSGLLVFLLANNNKNEWIDYFTITISFALFLLMILFIISLFSGISTGIENIFVQEAPGAIKTVSPGVPAIPTIICFILIGLSRLINQINLDNKKVYLWFGLPIAIIGGIAVLGYIVNIPQMYYTMTGYTSMAANTAFLFVLLGLSFMLLQQEERVTFSSSTKKIKSKPKRKSNSQLKKQKINTK